MISQAISRRLRSLNETEVIVNHDERTEEIARVGKASNPQEAQLWWQILEENGIRCQVVGEHLEQLFGAIPPSYPEVWVQRSDLQRARETINQYRVDHGLPEEDLADDGED